MCHRTSRIAYMQTYQIDFFSHIGHDFSQAQESFSRALGCVARRVPRAYTAVQVWVPAGSRGACSGRPKSRNGASNPREAFRPAR